MAQLPVESFTMFVEGLDHSECVSWGPDGFVYAGGEAGQLYRITLDGEVTQVGTTNGFVLGLCLDADSNAYLCDPGNGAVMRMTPSGEVSTYSDLPLVNPNYPVFDRAGNLYVSDSGGWHEENGRLFLIRPGGKTELIDDTLVQFPNGIALNAEEDYLYLAMSTMPGVVRIPVKDGAVTGKSELVVETPRAIPDGLAFDNEGTLYISCYTPDVIYTHRPGGALEVLAEDWQRVILASPTNITFAGTDRRTLVISSLCRWHLSKGDLDVAGQPYNYPSLAA